MIANKGLPTAVAMEEITNITWVEGGILEMGIKLRSAEPLGNLPISRSKVITMSQFRITLVLIALEPILMLIEV